MEEPGTGSLPHASGIRSVLIGKIIRKSTHFLQSAGALIIRQIQIGFNTPQQAIRLFRTGIAKGKVTEPRLQTEVLEMLAHIVTGNVANIEIKTHE
jgi:hypothetical protein